MLARVGYLNVDTCVATSMNTSPRLTRTPPTINQASLDKPFRARVTAAGQGTNAQFGPNQHMIVRWASSHNNTFSLAVVAAGTSEMRSYFLIQTKKGGGMII